MYHELKSLRDDGRGGVKDDPDFFRRARFYYLHFTHESFNGEVNQLNPFFIPVHNAMPAPSKFSVSIC